MRDYDVVKAFVPVRAIYTRSWPDLEMPFLVNGKVLFTSLPHEYVRYDTQVARLPGEYEHTEVVLSRNHPYYMYLADGTEAGTVTGGQLAKESGAWARHSDKKTVVKLITAACDRLGKDSASVRKDVAMNSNVTATVGGRGMDSRQQDVGLGLGQ